MNAQTTQLDWLDWLLGMNSYLAASDDFDYRHTMSYAIGKPGKFQAEAKVGLCRLIDGDAMKGVKRMESKP